RISMQHGDVGFDDFSLGERITAGERISRVCIIACGTSFHAGLTGRYLIEALARVPVDVELASEFRYRDPVLAEGTVVVPISQSGETADTLAALKMAKSRGC